MTWLLRPFLIAGLSTVLTTVGGGRLFGAPLGLTVPHWAFQPIARAEIPPGPTGSPIDQLVRAEMSGLVQAGRSDAII